MSKYKIEKNIELTKKLNTRFPFEDMEIGDSFLIPNPIENIVSVRVLLSAYSKNLRLKIGKFKIATSKTDEGLRVWRIE